MVLFFQTPEKASPYKGAMQFSVSFGCLGWRVKIVEKCHMYFSLRKKFLIPLFQLSEKRGLFEKLYITGGGSQLSTAKFL